MNNLLLCITITNIFTCSFMF